MLYNIDFYIVFEQILINFYDFVMRIVILNNNSLILLSMYIIINYIFFKFVKTYL